MNSREYIAFDNNFSKQDWNIAYVMFIEMLNEELEIQNSEERFYPISSQNDGRMVLLTKKQFEFIKENYPNDKEHPKELAVWKKKIIFIDKSQLNTHFNCKKTMNLI